MNRLHRFSVRAALAASLVFSAACANNTREPVVSAYVTYQATPQSDAVVMGSGMASSAKAFEFDDVSGRTQLVLQRTSTVVLFKPAGDLNSELDLAFYAADGKTRLKGIHCSPQDSGALGLEATLGVDGQAAYVLHVDADGVACAEDP